MMFFILSSTLPLRCHGGKVTRSRQGVLGEPSNFSIIIFRSPESDGEKKRGRKEQTKKRRKRRNREIKQERRGNKLNM